MTSELNEDCLKELEYYLCNKLANSHPFPGERVLAEFIIYLARKCDTTIDDFERNLKQNYGIFLII